MPPAAGLIPPKGAAPDGTELEQDEAEKAATGRMAWQKRTGYGLRSLGKTGVGRVKALNGGCLHARSFGAQAKEVAIQISALNRMIHAAKPVTVRR